MDSILNLLNTLSTWCLSYISQISLVLATLLIVLFVPLLNKNFQLLIRNMNVFIRVICAVIIYSIALLILNFFPNIIKQLLLQLNHYSLFPVLLVTAIVITAIITSMVTDRR